MVNSGKGVGGVGADGVRKTLTPLPPPASVFGVTGVEGVAQATNTTAIKAQATASSANRFAGASIGPIALPYLQQHHQYSSVSRVGCTTHGGFVTNKTAGHLFSIAGMACAGKSERRKAHARHHSSLYCSAFVLYWRIIANWASRHVRSRATATTALAASSC